MMHRIKLRTAFFVVCTLVTLAAILYDNYSLELAILQEKNLLISHEKNTLQLGKEMRFCQSSLGVLKPQLRSIEKSLLEAYKKLSDQISKETFVERETEAMWTHKILELEAILKSKTLIKDTVEEELNSIRKKSAKRRRKQKHRKVYEEQKDEPEEDKMEELDQEFKLIKKKKKNKKNKKIKPIESKTHYKDYEVENNE